MGLIPERCTKPQPIFENQNVVSIWCSFIVPTSHRGGSMRELFMLVPRGGKSIFRIAGPRREIASGFYKQRESTLICVFFGIYHVVADLICKKGTLVTFIKSKDGLLLHFHCSYFLYASGNRGELFILVLTFFLLYVTPHLANELL